ncbi:hypothetical protein HDU98_002041 [Podochytrium sp. JEL0797]|nr:hypothetical protein HDU98_002041 [Podochytrium sp. JEL0797]
MTFETPLHPDLAAAAHLTRVTLHALSVIVPGLESSSDLNHLVAVFVASSFRGKQRREDLPVMLLTALLLVHRIVKKAEAIRSLCDSLAELDLESLDSVKQNGMWQQRVPSDVLDMLACPTDLVIAGLMLAEASLSDTDTSTLAWARLAEPNDTFGLSPPSSLLLATAPPSASLLQQLARNCDASGLRAALASAPLGFVFSALGLEHVVFCAGLRDGAGVVALLLALDLSCVVGSDSLAAVSADLGEEDLFSASAFLAAQKTLRPRSLSRKDALGLALLRASSRGFPSVVKVLLEHGVDPKWRKKESFTPTERATTPTASGFSPSIPHTGPADRSEVSHSAPIESLIPMAASTVVAAAPPAFESEPSSKPLTIPPVSTHHTNHAPSSPSTPNTATTLNKSSREDLLRTPDLIRLATGTPESPSPNPSSTSLRETAFAAAAAASAATAAVMSEDGKMRDSMRTEAVSPQLKQQGYDRPQLVPALVTPSNRTARDMKRIPPGNRGSKYKQRVTLTSLPIPILHLILLYLPHKRDLAQVTSTCTLFSQICTSIEFMAMYILNVLGPYRALVSCLAGEQEGGGGGGDRAALVDAMVRRVDVAAVVERVVGEGGDLRGVEKVLGVLRGVEMKRVGEVVVRACVGRGEVQVLKRVVAVEGVDAWVGVEEAFWGGVEGGKGVEVFEVLVGARVDVGSEGWRAVKECAEVGGVDVLMGLVGVVVGAKGWDCVEEVYRILGREGNSGGLERVLRDRRTWDFEGGVARIVGPCVLECVKRGWVDCVRVVAESACWVQVVESVGADVLLDRAARYVFEEGEEDAATRVRKWKGRTVVQIDGDRYIPHSAAMVEYMVAGVAGARARFTAFETTVMKKGIDAHSFLSAAKPNERESPFEGIKAMVLLQAVWLGHEAVMDAVVTVLQPDLTGEAGLDVLVAAVCRGHTKMVASLISCGVDFEAGGGMAFVVAKDRGHVDTLKHLELMRGIRVKARKEAEERARKKEDAVKKEVEGRKRRLTVI